MRREADGFTLIELMATMVLLGILMAIAVPSWMKYRSSQEEVGTARELAGALRQAQVHASAEETTYRAVFAADGKSVTISRQDPTSGAWTQTSIVRPSTKTVTYATPSFTQSDGSSSSTCYFYARGAATKGTVTVVRSGSSKIYTISVEGLTARVSLS